MCVHTFAWLNLQRKIELQNIFYDTLKFYIGLQSPSYMPPNWVPGRTRQSPSLLIEYVQCGFVSESLFNPNLIFVGGPFVVGSGSGMAAPYTHTGRGAPGNYPPPNYSSAHGHQMPPAYSQQGFGYGPVGPPGGGHPRSPAPPYSPNINGGLQGQPVPSGGAHSGTPDRGGTFYTDPPPYSLVVEEAPLNPPAAPSDTTLYPPSNNRNTLATPRPPIH